MRWTARYVSFFRKREEPITVVEIWKDEKKIVSFSDVKEASQQERSRLVACAAMLGVAAAQASKTFKQFNESLKMVSFLTQERE